MTTTHHIPKPMAFGAGDTTCGLEVTPRITFSVHVKYINCPDCIATLRNEATSESVQGWLDAQPDKDKLTGKTPYDPGELLTVEEVARELGIDLEDLA